MSSENVDTCWLNSGGKVLNLPKQKKFERCKSAQLLYIFEKLQNEHLVLSIFYLVANISYDTAEIDLPQIAALFLVLDSTGFTFVEPRLRSTSRRSSGS